MTDRVLSRSERLHGLAATIVAMGVTSAIFSLSLPLFSTRLDEGGYSELVIGVNTAAQSIALLAVAPFTPRILRRYGPARPMIWGFAATLVFILLCPLYENAWYWLALRLAMGVSTGVLWIAGEAWVNEASEEATRGRNLAIYGVSAAAGSMAGFGIVFAVGHAGWTPFLIIAGLVAVCIATIATAVHAAPPFRGRASHAMIGLALVAPTPMTINLAVAVSFGSLAAFLAVYGVDVGLTHGDAYLLLVLLSAGGLLQYPVGWLADRVNRRLLGIVVMALTGILFALMDRAFDDPVLRWAWALLVGAGIMSLYTIALIMLGARFRGVDLGAATTVFQIFFNTGFVVGPLAVGAAMSAVGPDGLPWTLVAIHAAVIAFAAIRARR